MYVLAREFGVTPRQAWSELELWEWELLVEQHNAAAEDAQTD